MISFYKNRLQCLLWIIQSYIYTVSEKSCFQVNVLKMHFSMLCASQYCSRGRNHRSLKAS